MEIPEPTEEKLQALSDNELDILVAGKKERILTDPLRLRREFDSIIPEVNKDITDLYLSLGITAPPDLAPTSVNYFVDHDRFNMESHSKTDVGAAFERNKTIFVCLHCVQEKLRIFDSSIGTRELFGLPPQYGFFFITKLYAKYILHHENLHRIHDFSKKDVPSPTREMAVEFLEELLQSHDDLEESDLKAKEDLVSMHKGLVDAKQKGTLKVIQEGALLMFKSGDDAIAAYGESINEALVDHVGRKLTLEGFKGTKSSLPAFGKTFLSEIHPSEFTDAQIEKLFRYLDQRRLISFLSSSLFDGMLDKPTKRNVTRFLALLFERPEFFTV